MNYGSGNQDRMIQCVGTIDAGNSLSTEFGMFNETYVNVPSSYGNGPVFLRTVSNSDNVNYKCGATYSGNSAYIQGRTGTDFSYLGDVTAEYDNANMMRYETSEIADAFELVTDMQTINSVLQSMKNSNEDISFSFDSFDDVNIDPNDFLGELNNAYAMSDKCEFRFNAILLYYSVYDLNDAYKQPVATNLFGIVFLDGGAGTETSSYALAPLLKRKSFHG